MSFHDRHPMLDHVQMLSDEMERALAITAREARRYGTQLLRERPALFEHFLVDETAYARFAEYFTRTNGAKLTESYGHYNRLLLHHGSKAIPYKRSKTPTLTPEEHLRQMLETAELRGEGLLRLHRHVKGEEKVCLEGVVAEYLGSRNAIVCGVLRGVAATVLETSRRYAHYFGGYIDKKEEFEDELFDRGTDFVEQSLDNFEPERNIRFYSFFRESLEHRTNTAARLVFKELMKTTPFSSRQDEEGHEIEDWHAMSQATPLWPRHMLDPDEGLLYQEKLQIAKEVLAQLPERSRQILLLRQELTLDETGKALKITRERVRQLEAKTMDKVHALLRERSCEPVFKLEKHYKTAGAP